MTINLSQNQEVIKQHNFGAAGLPSVENTAQANTLKSMSIPTTPDEFVKFAPFGLGALGFSKLVSHLATVIGRANPLKNPKQTVAESYANSSISNLSRKVDNAILPITQKYATQINGVKSTFSKLTPNWVKDLAKKIQIGVKPKNTMALAQYNGLTVSSARYFLDDILGSISPQKLESLGIANIKNLASAQKIAPTKAVELIAQKLAQLPAKDLQAIPVTNAKGLFSFLKSGKVNLINELNKSRSFIASNAKTSVAKGLQKGIMSVGESAGGGVIGGTFGIIMNSIFLASTLKRTWEAPWGEKLSTFMEGALGDFCGGYLMMLLGTKITYKLLGIKNADKSLTQLKDIKALTAKVIQDKHNYRMVQQAFKSGAIDPSLIQSLGINPSTIKSKADLLNILKTKVPNAATINASIDKLAKLKAFKSQGFFKDLINRPLRWIGNFFSVGLESLPAKVADGKKISAFKAGWQGFKNILKGIAGYPVRFILVAMIMTPPLQKLCVKISHKLFGKPTNSAYDYDKESEKKTASLGQQIKMSDFADFTKATGMLKAQAQAQAQGQVPAANMSMPQQIIPPQISDGLINRTLQNQQERIVKQQQPEIVNQTEISPATYIPSVAPVSFVDSSVADEMNRKLQYSEKVGKYIDKELKLLKNGDCFDF